jgi:hypothetical protein
VEGDEEMGWREKIELRRRMRIKRARRGKYE